MPSDFQKQYPCPRGDSQTAAPAETCIYRRWQLLWDLLWDKSLYPLRLVVSPTLLQVQTTYSLPGVGASQPADTSTPWEFTGVTTKGITCFPAAIAPLPLTISLPSWFPGADQQTLWSLQGGCLAAHVFSPSSTWVMLGCIQHLMSAWQDSSVMLQSFAKAKGQCDGWDPSEELHCSHQQGPTLTSGTAGSILQIQAGAVGNTAHMLSLLVTKPYEAQLTENLFPFPAKIHQYFEKTNKIPKFCFTSE